MSNITIPPILMTHILVCLITSNFHTELTYVASPCNFIVIDSIEFQFINYQIDRFPN